MIMIVRDVIIRLLFIYAAKLIRPHPNIFLCFNLTVLKKIKRKLKGIFTGGY